MSFTRSLAMRMFGRPRGVLGRLGGHLMARMNADFGEWVAGLLEIGARERVLEVGFGAGVIIEKLAGLVPEGHVAGVDASAEMVAQARARNAEAGRSGLVELRCS
jgi:SAM-dependent methyltransferase